MQSLRSHKSFDNAIVLNNSLHTYIHLRCNTFILHIITSSEMRVHTGVLKGPITHSIKPKDLLVKVNDIPELPEYEYAVPWYLTFVIPFGAAATGCSSLEKLVRCTWIGKLMADVNSPERSACSSELCLVSWSESHTTPKEYASFCFPRVKLQRVKLLEIKPWFHLSGKFYCHSAIYLHQDR